MVKIKPISVIKANLGIEPNGRVQKFFANTCAKHMDKYVPMRDGNLVQCKVEANRIIYDQLYARYQYYGISKKGKAFRYSKDKHPLATSQWDKKMVSAEMGQVVKEVQEYIKRG